MPRKDKLVTPKTLEQVIAQLEDADKFEPSAIICRVKSAEPPELKDSTFGSGQYSDQKVVFESKAGKTIYGYSKSEEVDFQDLEDEVVILAQPGFTTKNAQVSAKTNGNYINIYVGKMVEVWAPMQAATDDWECVNDSDDADKREWRFDLGKVEASQPAPQARNEGHTIGGGKKEVNHGEEKSSNKNIVASFTREVVSLSKIATKYSEAIVYAQQIANEVGIDDQQAIQAMAATIFINYSHQPGASMELEDNAVNAAEPLKEVEEEKPARKSRKKAVVEEPEADEDNSEEGEEEVTPRPKRRSSPRSSNSTQTSTAASGSRKRTKR